MSEDACRCKFISLGDVQQSWFWGTCADALAKLEKLPQTNAVQFASIKTLTEARQVCVRTRVRGGNVGTLRTVIAHEQARLAALAKQ